MLSGNEYSHNECLTADDADGKAGLLAGGALRTVRVNKKSPIGEEGEGDTTEVGISPQSTIFQNIGAEKSSSPNMSHREKAKGCSRLQRHNLQAR